MPFKKVIAAEDAVSLIQDSDYVASAGYGGNGVPEKLLAALEQRFLDTGAPRDLTLMYAGGQGDGREKGLNRLAHEGLLKRVIGGHYGLIPKLEALAVDDKIEAYNIPEGIVTHLYRDIAASKPGTLSKVGIGTFVDPRVEGGKVNAAAKEDLVELVELGGEETLFFKSMPVNVALIRGTTADPDGNITMEKESLRLEALAMAMAAHNTGGIVICQVERIAEAGSLDARRVRIPGMVVDAVVLSEPEFHMQNYGTQYNPALSGEVRVPLETLPALPLDAKKVIARRAAMELSPNTVVNLGIGLPDTIGAVANEEKIHDLFSLTADPGVFGGVPLGGLDFGAAVNFCAAIEHTSQFDFIDGGGLDAAFLGFAECDGRGDVNASRFGRRISGCGGFINISQNSKKVVFVGTFTSGGFEAEVADGRLKVLQEGKHRKFVDKVGQITFSGRLAADNHREIIYVTERCVFRLGPEGLVLSEVAPGLDLEKDILRHIPFRPEVTEPAEMEPAIFQPEPMDLRSRLLDLRIEDRISYDPESNTLFLNYAGMTVRNQDDLDAIKEAVDATLAPLGKKVYAVVNYDSFSADEAVADKYLDLVRYVEKTYYISVSRHTTNGFMRLKLGQEFTKRRITSDLYESQAEAERFLEDN